jgi:hypothetical protein
MFLPLPAEERSRRQQALRSVGTLTPETIRDALDALWLRPWDLVLPTGGWRLVVPEAAIEAAVAEEADRAAWIDGIRQRLGLVTLTDTL